MIKIFKKNKIKSILVLVIFILTVLLFMHYNIPRIKYVYDEIEDCYVVYEAYGNSKEYKIKTTYKGKEVGIIGKRAFKNHTKLKKVDFGENSNIFFIEAGAFFNCNSLETFFLPNSVVRIENNAFASCTSLKEFTFEEDSKLKSISGSMFINCHSLKTIVLPKTITEIGTFAFFNCYSLESITIPFNTLNIYDDVFFNCNELKEIVFLNFSTNTSKDWLGNLNPDNITILYQK